MAKHVDLVILGIEDMLFHSKNYWMNLLNFPEVILCPSQEEHRGFWNKEMIADLCRINESNQELDVFVVEIDF